MVSEPQRIISAFLPPVEAAYGWQFALIGCAVRHMDKLDALLKVYEFVLTYNPKTRRSVISWIFMDGRRVYVIICGRDARYASNALYHALRATGRRGVRRSASNKCWVVSYI
jgi:hypothetical protein